MIFFQTWYMGDFFGIYHMDILKQYQKQFLSYGQS
jgi:hypothetical protein